MIPIEDVKKAEVDVEKEKKILHPRCNKTGITEIIVFYTLIHLRF
jgi:hypothetical protein